MSHPFNFFCKLDMQMHFLTQCQTLLHLRLMHAMQYHPILKHAAAHAGPVQGTRSHLSLVQCLMARARLAHTRRRPQEDAALLLRRHQRVQRQHLRSPRTLLSKQAYVACPRAMGVYC